MTRTGTVLMATLVFLACMHTRETEDQQEARQAEEKPREAKKEQREKKQSTDRQARRDREVKRPAAPGRPELASDPTGLMTPDAPMQLQRRLAELGYYSGEVTGELDEKTAAALVKFQGEHDLAKTGAPDRDTIEALGLDPDQIWRRNAEKK